MTQLGLILGTAAYMSPEQAKGRQADKRSDVWAFGAVLYEMLSGQRAFKGDDVSDTLAAVLRQDVDWNALPASTPAPVRRLIARCLDRDVRRRLRDIGEARIVLDDPAALAGRKSCQRAHRRPAAPVAADLAACDSSRALRILVAGGLAATAAWSFKPSTPLHVTRFLFTPPDGQPFTGLARRVIDISPDGTQIVYAANGRLYLRLMSELDARAIPGTDIYQAVTNPVFSPDGRSVAFHATSDQTIKKIAVTGGAAVTLCTAAMPYGMSWGSNGIVFSQGTQGIKLVSAEGGTPPDVLVPPKDGEVPASPQMLPGGRSVLFAVATGTALNRWDTADIVAQSVATGLRQDHHQGRSRPALMSRPVTSSTPSAAVCTRFHSTQQTMKATGSPAPVVDGRQASLG